MLRSRACISGLLALFIASCSAEGPSDNPVVQVIKSDAYDVSPPLTELAMLPALESFTRSHEASPVRMLPHMQLQETAQPVDPIMQTALGTGLSLSNPIANFEGQGAGLPGSSVTSAPPDTDGDIGPNHYVQIVNNQVTVFSRAGSPLFGPVNTNTIWSGFNGACSNTNDGDGVVRYDRMADRWVISQFSVNGGSGPFFECIAVSTSPDPTGTYNRYQFPFDADNDYPKMGLWPDAYYFTYNMFRSNTFAGARACAVDRTSMLAGRTATQQCFDTGRQFGGLLASDLDGAALPPPGAPNTLVALYTTALDVWHFHVDFANSANSTFTGPTVVPVAAYTQLCNGGTCIVQPGTSTRLDSLADRLMNRLVYRRFVDHEALLVSHAVTAGSGGGIRWYELRNPSSPTIFQQGTYAPDSGFRWMSSQTFDRDGNIGLGYSISSSSINPGIRYTGRLVSDAAGTMGQGEATIVAGTGSQTDGLSRWGDYSSMNIDPTDDCSFWYTQEYIATSGTFNWHTRVGSFRFPACGQSIRTAVNADGRLEAFRIGADGRALHTWQTQPAAAWFGSWELFDTSGTRLSSLDVARNADGRLEAIGIATDGSVFHSWQQQPSTAWLGTWQPFYSANDKLRSVKLVQNADGRLEAIGIGTNGVVFHTWQTQPSTAWFGSWQRFDSGANQISSLDVGQNADGRLEVIGIAPDGSVLHTWQQQPSTAWLGTWQPFYSSIDRLSSVKLVRNADGRLEALAISPAGFVFHTWQTQPSAAWFGSWQRFDSNGNQLSSLDVAQNADGRLEAIGIATDGTVLHSWQQQPSTAWLGTWQPFYSTNDRLTTLNVIQNSDGRLEAIGIAPGGNPLHTWQTQPSAAWFGSWTSFY